MLLLAVLDSRSRSSKESVSTLNEDSNDSSLQFHLSLNDDIDDGIVSDADDSAGEDDDNDQVFRTPVNAKQCTVESGNDRFDRSAFAVASNRSSLGLQRSSSSTRPSQEEAHCDLHA